MPAESREMVRAVYASKSGIVSLDALKELVDPLDRSGSKARKEALYKAVDWGFLTFGKHGGAFVVSVPWVAIEEVLLGHPSVSGSGGAWRPVFPVSVAKPAAVAKPGAVPVEAVEAVWSAFCRITGKKFKLNDRRRKACKELAAAHSLAEIETAFHGLSESPFHRGENDAGVEYIEPHLVARNFNMFFQMGVADGG